MQNRRAQRRRIRGAGQHPALPTIVYHQPVVLAATRAAVGVAGRLAIRVRAKLNVARLSVGRANIRYESRFHSNPLATLRA